jgi:hypothetical protein
MFKPCGVYACTGTASSAPTFTWHENFVSDIFRPLHKIQDCPRNKNLVTNVIHLRLLSETVVLFLARQLELNVQ